MSYKLMKFVYANHYQICFLVVSDNHSRVILSGDENTDYINASFIDVGANMEKRTLLYKHKCYIEFLATEKNRI